MVEQVNDASLIQWIILGAELIILLLVVALLRRLGIGMVKLEAKLFAQDVQIGLRFNGKELHSEVIPDSGRPPGGPSSEDPRILP